jgi:phosphatidylglycerol lysyltransferase
MGDPVGPEEEAENLIWQFLEDCDEAGARPAFYEVEHRRVHLYLDAGLSLLKIGEEGRVFLPEFSLAGNERKGMRYIRNKLTRAGHRFEIRPAKEAAELIPEVRAISDAWLSQKNTREKGFSLGFFKEDYLRRFPLALVWRHDKLCAFANLLEGANHEELSVDLMRYLPGESDLMEFLFLELMLWGQAEGYRWFNLGMAPLSGLGNLPSRSRWNRLGHFLFRYGEHFYNFQGLREYKEKFSPVWEPRYLAYPGGLTLPRVLADIAALISGGLKGVITK